MPVIGSEQGGIRPVLIIQNDVGNCYSPTVIVAAITIDRIRLRGYVGSLSGAMMRKVDEAILVSFGVTVQRRT